MVKHNNILPNVHLRKHWQRWVKTFFNQPGRKRRRLDARKLKATKVFPRPLQPVRPIVQSCSQRYSGRPRIGRGFTLDELKKANISEKFARSVGIAVDHRRKNRNTEAFKRNVDRLAAYKSKLVLLPRNPKKLKKAAKNSTIAETDAKADGQVQNKTRDVIALPKVELKEKPIKITPAMKLFNPKVTLKLELVNQKWKGKREKRAKEEAAKATDEAK